MKIRSYNAFLRESKRAHGLTHKQAQELYRGAKERLGRSPKGVDVKRHPRIIKQEAQKAVERERQKERKHKEKAELIHEQLKKAGKFKSMAEYHAWLDLHEEYDWYEYEDSADYLG